MAVTNAEELVADDGGFHLGGLRSSIGPDGEHRRDVMMEQKFTFRCEQLGGFHRRHLLSDSCELIAVSRDLVLLAVVCSSALVWVR
jgi:hypothetical protein